MKRRAVIRDLVLLTAGTAFLPTCKTAPAKALVKLKNFKIDSDQEQLLSEVAGTIIPKTSIPGAKETDAHLFVLKMLDDCYEKEDQQKFIAGLNNLDAEAKKLYGNTFGAGTVSQRSQLLEKIEKGKDVPEPTGYFYGVMKHRTIQGYMESKYVMTNVVIYEIIPKTPYNGFAPA